MCTPTNYNNHVELAHAQLVGEVAKKNRARFARVKYLQQLRKHPPLSNPGYAPDKYILSAQPINHTQQKQKG